MKKIPTAYTQQHSQKELIKIIDLIRTQLWIDLKQYYSLHTIDAPLIQSSLLSFQSNRWINFDNFKDGSLYQYLDYPDLALIELIHASDNKDGLMTYYLSINRDSEYTFIKGVYEYKLLIEKGILFVEANDEIIKKHASEMITLINNVINSLKIPHAINIPTNIKVVTLQQLKKYYPTIALKDAINEYVRIDESVLLFDLDESFEHIQRKSIVSFVKNASLYVKSNVNNELIRLMSFNLSPQKQEISARFKYERNNETMTQLLQTHPNLFSEYHDVLGIEVNFNRLILYLLKKLHIAEVLSVPISKDLMEQFKRNKLSRF